MRAAPPRLAPKEVTAAWIAELFDAATKADSAVIHKSTRVLDTFAEQDVPKGEVQNVRLVEGLMARRGDEPTAVETVFACTKRS